MFGKLRSFLGRREKRRATTGLGPELIHIHEDDWGLRSLHPLAAFPEVTRDMAAASEASERNRVPSGHGWTDMHLIQSPASTYVQAGLTLAAADFALSPILPRVTRFYATASAGFEQQDPWGSYDEGAWCYGLTPECFIKLEPDGVFVKEIWFCLYEPDAGRALAIRRAMQAIDRLVPSLIADYVLDECGPIGDGAFLDRYLAMLTRD